MDWIKGCEPEFEIGQEVYPASLRSCPRPPEKPYPILGYDCILLDDGLVCTSYKISLFNIRPVRPDFRWFQEEWLSEQDCEELRRIFTALDGRMDTAWQRRELFLDKDEAAAACAKKEVSGITDDEWMAMIGSREDSSYCESELAPCCAAISEVRDLLYSCWADGAICARDVRCIESYIRDSGHECLIDEPEDFPLLAKVFKQVGIEPHG